MLIIVSLGCRILGGLKMVPIRMLGLLETYIPVNIDSISFGEYNCKSCGTLYKGFTDIQMSEPPDADSV